MCMGCKMTNDKETRVIYLEYLRVIAMLSVVLLHVTSKAISLVEVHTTAWHIYNFCRCFCKWGVDIFIMISGALFLNPKRNITIKKIYKKYVSRVVLILVIWSLAYAVYPVIRDLLFGIEISWDERFPNVVRNFVLGNYHLWYLYMLIGLYMLTPFLKEIVKKRENMIYYLVLSAIFTVLLPLFSNIEKMELLVSFLNQIHLNMVTGYTFIYVLGYYLSIHDFSPKQVLGFKILCVLELLLTIFLTETSDKGLFLIDGVFSVGIIVISICLFVICKYSKWISKGVLSTIIMVLSEYSLGIYLIHAFFVHAITIKCVEWFEPGIDIVISFSTILVISCIGIYILKKIPYLGRTIG